MECQHCHKELLSGESIMCETCRQTAVRRIHDECIRHEQNGDCEQACDLLEKACARLGDPPLLQNDHARLTMKIKKCNDLRISSDELFNTHKYHEAIIQLTELLEYAPHDEAAHKTRQLAAVLAGVDLSQYTSQPARDPSAPQVWQHKDISYAVRVVLACGAILIMLMFLSVKLHGWHRYNQSAADLYSLVKQRVTMHEYETTGFLHDYEQLINDYGDTRYATEAQRDFAALYTRSKTAIAEKLMKYRHEGEDFFKQGNYEKAIRSWERVLQLAPADVAILQDIQNARDKLIWENQLSADEKRGLSFENHYALAERYEHDGDYAAALSEYHKAAEYQIGNRAVAAKIDAVTRLAHAEASTGLNVATATDQGGPDGAMISEESEPITVEQPDDSVTGTLISNATRHAINKALLEGQRHFDQGHYVPAIKAWERAYQLDMVGGESLLQVIKKTRSILEREEQIVTQLKEKAVMYEEHHMWHQALLAYQELLGYRPRSFFVRERIRNVQIQLAPPPEASLLEKISQSIYQGIHTMIRAARTHKTLMIASTKTIVSDPLYPIRAFIADRGRHLRDRLRQFKNARAEQLQTRARLADKQGDFAYAWRCYRKAYALSNNKKLLDEMILSNILKTALKDSPHSASSDSSRLLVIGSAYYAKGWFEEARKAYEKALGDNSQHTAIKRLALAFIGKVNEELGFFSQAQDYYEQALALGDVYYIRGSLAEVLAKQGDLSAAYKQWRMLLKHRPYQLEYLTHLVQYALPDPEAEQLITASLTDMRLFSAGELASYQYYPATIRPEVCVLSRDPDVMFREAKHFFLRLLKKTLFFMPTDPWVNDRPL